MTLHLHRPAHSVTPGLTRSPAAFGGVGAGRGVEKKSGTPGQARGDDEGDAQRAWEFAA